MFGKQKVAALAAEFIGTGALTLLVLSVQRSTIGVPFFVAMGAGLTVILMSLIFGGISGGYFNPALTFALWTARKVTTIRAITFIAVQFLGAWAAYYLYTYYVNSSLQPIGGHFTARIMIAEAVGTAIFAFGFAAAIYQGLNRATASVIAGLGLMIGIVAASSASLGLLNPAVALGVRALVWGTYVLGPVAGAIVGVNLYGMLFAEESSLKGLFAASTSSSSTTAKKTVVAAPAPKPVAKKATAKKKPASKKKK